MEFKVHSHRHALDILNKVPEYQTLWEEIQDSLSAVTDEKLADHFQRNYIDKGKAKKSLSSSINLLLKEEFSSRGWTPESYIFGESYYGDHDWRLDFAKKVQLPEDDAQNPAAVESGISIEVAFNHGGSIMWNLLKPVVASEVNHVKKLIQTGIGVVITATNDMKDAGGFDSAIGTYENYVSNLLPLRNILTVPVLIIGLEAPKKFRVGVEQRGNQKFGQIHWLN